MLDLVLVHLTGIDRIGDEVYQNSMDALPVEYGLTYIIVEIDGEIDSTLHRPFLVKAMDLGSDVIWI